MDLHAGAPRSAQGPRVALVTGGAGFIGAALALRLVQAGWRVVALDDLSAGDRARLASVDGSALTFLRADVCDRALVRDLVARESFDTVFHLAGCVGVRRVLADPALCAHSNRAGAASVSAALAALPPGRRPRAFFASTSEVYAERLGPLREDAALRAHATDGRFAYASSKLDGERSFARATADEGDRGAVLLRFFNVVGPGQDATSGMVLPRFVEQAARGEALTVYGDGEQVRTFAHVDDVAAVLARLAEHAQVPAGPLNVGGTARATLLELAHAVVRASGSTAGVRRVDPRVELGRGFADVRSREPDLTRLARVLGAGADIPSRSLADIVADTWARHAAHAPSRTETRTCASLAS
jgi:UDP-glucose 4-epimerase